MADKKEPKTQISAASALITTPVNAATAQNIAIQAIANAKTTSSAALKELSGGSLKSSVETRLKSDAGPVSPKGSAVINNSQKPTEEQTELERWIYLQRIKQAAEDRAEAFEDINYHLFTAEELLKKGNLETEDVFRADTRDISVFGMPVLRVDEKDGSRYYVGNNLSNYLSSHPQHTGRMTNMGEAQHQVYQKQFPTIDLSGTTHLNPRLAERMRRDPTVANYVEMTFEAAKRNGLDPVLLANQFWQESKFNPNAQSHAGAKGISQMMPFQQGKYGLQNEADFTDAPKSIEAGARMMAHLTQKNGGDQRLALVAYNGGGGAIDFVEKSLGKKDISFNDWQNFMSDRRNKLGDSQRSAWHVETLDYTRIIAGVPAPQPS